MDEDLLKAARMETPDGPRAPIADRGEIPAVSEVATQLGLAALRFPPLVAEHAVPEPLLAPELWTDRILRAAQREELAEAVVQLGLRPSLMDALLRFLLFFLLLLRLLPLGGLLRGLLLLRLLRLLRL